MPAGIASSATPSVISRVVQELSAAATAVQDAAQAMGNNKEAWRKVAKIARQIQTCVDNSARSAHEPHKGLLPFVVIATMGATRDVFLECASFMRDSAAKGTFARLRQKGTTADAAAGYLATVEGLRELLGARNNECELMTNASPDFSLLVTSVKSTKDKDGLVYNPPALPDINTPWTKDLLEANITKVDAAYDGLKTTLNVMMNITDGLPWPLKAAPQTLLYILQLFEDYRDARPKITSLLYSVQQMWDTLETVTKRMSLEGDYLQRRFSGFFETLWRIVIRLRMVLRAGWMKRAMAIHSVNACLDVERQRIQEARDDIVLTFQGETLIRVDETGKLVRDIHVKMERLQVVESQTPSVSTTWITKTLPPKPEVFHGRDEFVSDAVGLLTQTGTVRLAVLGAGGMGKTSVALAILHTDSVIQHYGNGRLFLSCEALSDADSLLIAIAKLLGLEASNDLLTTIVTHLTAGSRMLLVLDNLETVWLVEDVSKVAAVERLLSTLSQIPTLSLVITCRGNVLPPRIRWSNASNAALAPFSLEAAMRTFEDTSGRGLVDQDRIIAEQLLREVDMMPLAVTLLGQLRQRGILVSELLSRWTRTRNALFRVRPAGREYNVEVSIEVSIELVRAATGSPEPLQLLSIYSLLPDGMRPPVFEELRGHFDDIDYARQTLCDYALASIGSDGEVHTLSPVRHFVLSRYPPVSGHHAALCSIYFSIASRLGGMDDGFKDRAAAAAPEMGNLSSLLLMLVHEPSLQLFQAVMDFTSFAYWQQPTVTVACALLPHLEGHIDWKAHCLHAIGNVQARLGEHRSAIDYVTTAAQLHLEVDDLSSAARCKRLAGDIYRLLGEVNRAESSLTAAYTIYTNLGYEIDVARCRRDLGALMMEIEEYRAAVEHLTVARQTFDSLGDAFGVAQCSESLGMIHLFEQDLGSAAVELEASRSAFANFGDKFHQAQSTRVLSSVHRMQNNLAQADMLLAEAEDICKDTRDQEGIAACALEFGWLRREQGRPEEAIAHIGSALQLYVTLGLERYANGCRELLQLVQYDMQY